MAKISHLISTTSGDVPASLLRGQLAINFPDKLVYAATPDGPVAPISSGVPGLTNASSLLTAHIPIQFHPVAQFAPGYTQAQLTSLFTADFLNTTMTLQPLPVFALGQLMYTPVLTCAVVTTGAYLLTVDLVARTCSIAGMSAPLPAISGTYNPINNTFNIVFFSDSTILPWFYLPAFQGVPNGTVGASPGDCPLYRISPIQTFGAIPVSAGFAGAAATSYWGVPS